jgi:hypothetical protein
VTIATRLNRLELLAPPGGPDGPVETHVWLVINPRGDCPPPGTVVETIPGVFFHWYAPGDGAEEV